MSDEQRRQRAKGPRPFGLRRKSPPGSSSDFGRNAARGNNEL
jgi:hypothetical protein